MERLKCEIRAMRADDQQHALPARRGDLCTRSPRAPAIPSAITPPSCWTARRAPRSSSPRPTGDRRLRRRRGRGRRPGPALPLRQPRATRPRRSPTSCSTGPRAWPSTAARGVSTASSPPATSRRCACTAATTSRARPARRPTELIAWRNACPSA